MTAVLIAGCGGSGGSDRNQAGVPPAQAVNSAPVARVSGPVSIDERSLAELDGSGSSDADSDPLSYSWSLVSAASAAVTLGDVSSSILSVDIGEAIADENLEFRLVVSDDSGDSDEAIFTLLISELDRDRLPPHPGANGLAGIVGIDSDTNGIRDDVEIAIYERHPADAQAREGLGNFALTLQSALASMESGGTFERAIAAGGVVLQSACLVTRFDRPALEVAFVTGATANTNERIAAYLVFNESQAGTSFRVPDFDAECRP